MYVIQSTLNVSQEAKRQEHGRGEAGHFNILHTYIGWGFSLTYISAYISSAVEIMFTTTIEFLKNFLPLNKIKEERLDGRRKCEQASNYPPGSGGGP